MLRPRCECRLNFTEKAEKIYKIKIWAILLLTLCHLHVCILQVVVVVVTSDEEGGDVFTLVCLSVCLSVCPSDNWKSCEWILTKFLGGVGPGTKGINFGDDPDPHHYPDPGVHSRSRSGKNCHVVNTHRTDALSADRQPSYVGVRQRSVLSECFYMLLLLLLLLWHVACN